MLEIGIPQGLELRPCNSQPASTILPEGAKISYSRLKIIQPGGMVGQEKNVKRLQRNIDKMSESAKRGRMYYVEKCKGRVFFF